MTIESWMRRFFFLQGVTLIPVYLQLLSHRTHTVADLIWLACGAVMNSGLVLLLAEEEMQ